MQAIKGIVSGLLTLLLVGTQLGAGDIHPIRAYASSYWILACFAFYGVFFLIYGIILLHKTNNNDRAGVFKIIKIGSIIMAAMDIISASISTVERIEEEGFDGAAVWVGVSLAVLFCLMSVMVISGIISESIGLVTAFIYDRIIIMIMVNFPLLFLLFILSTTTSEISLLIIPLFIILDILLFNHLLIFVLQVNVMVLKRMPFDTNNA